MKEYTKTKYNKTTTWSYISANITKGMPTTGTTWAYARSSSLLVTLSMTPRESEKQGCGFGKIRLCRAGF